jgi:hypothetical protein
MDPELPKVVGGLYTSDIFFDFANQIPHGPQRFKEDIKEVLKSELVTRYWYQTGRVEAMLHSDPAVKQALGRTERPGLPTDPGRHPQGRLNRAHGAGGAVADQEAAAQ